jgi:hypothetical protein
MSTIKNEMPSMQDVALALTERELDDVSGGMLAQFTYGDTSILVWANAQAHATIVVKCSCK